MIRENMKMIHLGNGEKSELLVRRLKKRFDDAINDLCGIQQPNDPTQPWTDADHAADKAQRDEAEQRIEVFARDLVTALTGRQLMLNGKTYPQCQACGAFVPPSHQHEETIEGVVHQGHVYPAPTCDDPDCDTFMSGEAFCSGPVIKVEA